MQSDIEGLTISFQRAAKKTLPLIMTRTPPGTGPTVAPRVTVKPQIAGKENGKCCGQTRRFQTRPASHVHAQPNSQVTTSAQITKRNTEQSSNLKSRQCQTLLRGKESETSVVVNHNRDELRQQATIEEEKTMLTPEGTPVHSVGHRD